MANCSDCFNFGDCLQYEGTKYYGLDAACDNVEELCENFKNKADFVEVVRCRNCKHAYFRYNTKDTLQEIYACKKRPVGRTHKKVSGDFFCKHGKRKDE